MGIIRIPTNQIIKGPWLLDVRALEELHEVLVKVEAKLNESFTIAVNNKIQSNSQKYGRTFEKTDIEKEKERIIEYSHLKNEVAVFTKQGKQIIFDNLPSLLVDNQIDEFVLTKLTILMVKEPCKFTLEITSEPFDQLELQIQSVDSTIYNEIKYEIDKWTDRHKPNLALQKWSSWFPFAIAPMTFILIILFLISNVTNNNHNINRTELAKKCSSLLQGGLTEEETTKAVEIILQFQIVDKYNTDLTINQDWIFVGIFVLIALTILSVRPKTIIGLGKNKLKLKFYKTWIKFVLIFVPTSIILPIIINILF